LSFGQISELQGFVSGEYLLFINENLTVATFTAFQGFVKDSDEFAFVLLDDFFHQILHFYMVFADCFLIVVIRASPSVDDQLMGKLDS
jgi:hypothetical protein